MADAKPDQPKQQEAPKTDEASLAEHLQAMRIQINSGLSNCQSYSPFLYGVGRRALVGAAWGGVFGLLFFSRTSWRKFSMLYGAGFGIGMCAPTFIQLKDAFFANPLDKDLTSTQMSDAEFYSELDSI